LPCLTNIFFEKDLKLRVPPNVFFIRQGVIATRCEKRRHFKTLECLLMQATVAEQELSRLHSGMARIGEAVLTLLVPPEAEKCVLVFFEAILVD
jgi:hypothetical protein